MEEAAARLPSAHAKRDPGGCEPLPKRHRDLAIDMDALRLMLEDQAKTVMAAQDRAVTQAINGLEERHGRALERWAQQQESQGVDLQQLKGTVLNKRV